MCVKVKSGEDDNAGIGLGAYVEYAFLPFRVEIETVYYDHARFGFRTHVENVSVGGGYMSAYLQVLASARG